MATTSLKDVALGIKNIGARTNFAGAAATDFSAEEDRFINSILAEGVIKPSGAFQTVAGAAASMNVVVGSGASKSDYFVVEGTSPGQGNYIVRLEAATETFALSAADPANARKDEVYIVVQDDAYDSSGRALPVLAVRQGDPSGSPAAPGPDGAWDAYALIATVDVPGAAADILACTVTDERSSASMSLPLFEIVVAGGYTGNLTGGSINTTYKAVTQLDLVIPTDWNTYDVVIEAVQLSGTGGANFVDARFRADVLGSATTATVITNGQEYQPSTYAAAHKFTGLTPTGSVRFDFQMRTTSSTLVTIVPGSLKATAVRTS